MPGQMGVILADAHVPDGLILPSQDVEDGFRSADIVLVIGANDVVNTAADVMKTLPMFGIPSLDAGLSRKLYVIKRGGGGRVLRNPEYDLRRRKLQPYPRRRTDGIDQNGRCAASGGLSGRGLMRAAVAAAFAQLIQTGFSPRSSVRPHWARHAPASNGSAKYCVSLATLSPLNSMMLTVWEGFPS